MHNERKATPGKEAALKQIRDEFTGTTGKSQCERLLAALAQFPVTTFEAMRHLDVYHVPARGDVPMAVERGRMTVPLS